jgi:predicted RNA-binding protein with PIN domain
MVHAIDLPQRLLRPALVTARHTLRDLQADEIPPSLRRVAGWSGNRLPPPLAESLIRELDRNDWLRERVAEGWEEKVEADSSDAERASELFLVRPNGWEQELAVLGEQTAQEDLAGEIGKLGVELERARDELEVARRKARAAERRAQEAEREAQHRVKATKAGVEQARSAQASESAELRRRLDEVTAERDRLAAELTETIERLATTRAELLRERRSESARSQSAPSAWSLRDPMELARHLDELAAAAEPPPKSVEPQTGAHEVPGLSVPVGISPDASVSVEWLVRQPAAFTLIVDGYNVTFHLDRARFHTALLRDRLNGELAKLQRISTGKVRVIVVYDSSQGKTDEPAAPGPVEVRFTEPDVLADQEILSLVPQLEGALVVVSSDRVVREGAEEHGALGLWSEALADWIRGR